MAEKPTLNPPMASVDPLTIRRRFANRDTTSIATLAVVFFALLCLLFWLGAVLDAGWFGNFIAIGITIAAVFYLHKLWSNAPELMVCDHCKKSIGSDTPWVCGGCGHKNLNANEFSFANRCEKCRLEPKAYICHHNGCGKIVYLTDEKLAVKCARWLHAPTEAVQEPEEVKTRREKLEGDARALADKEFELKMATLNAKIVAIKPPELPSPSDQKLKIMKEELAGLTKISDEIEKLRLEAKELYKHDEKNLRRMNDLLDHLQRKHGM